MKTAISRLLLTIAVVINYGQVNGQGRENLQETDSFRDLVNTIIITRSVSPDIVIMVRVHPDSSLMQQPMGRINELARTFNAHDWVIKIPVSTPDMKYILILFSSKEKELSINSMLFFETIDLATAMIACR